MNDVVPDSIYELLGTPTPAAWLEHAVTELPRLLNDHANCEKKAASSALAIMFRYPQDRPLAAAMSRLAREELRHYEQVLALMQRRGIEHDSVRPSAYAQRLHAACRRSEPGRLTDTLLVGALIEARSCERFAALVEVLDDELAGFYRRLLRSEARHFQSYLRFATERAGDTGERLAQLVALEAELIDGEDTVFAFHSGRPQPSARQEA
ncbi:MAG: tRNA-(ms[2]io[6]A)-hydroxylase [Gammaproteobacteria bacterium]|nr:tRNA-(ms[2]io[6]A)-hydroxylase [Gammaproteobacteria bacterium]